MVRSGKISRNLQEKAKDAKEFVHASADLSSELRWDVGLAILMPHLHALARPSWPVRVFSVQTEQQGAPGATVAQPFAVVAEDAVAKPMTKKHHRLRGAS